MSSYYNENDPKAAAWLRELITNGHIAPGEVDERSIEDVKPDDLAGFVQCHFFAGIGGWSLALRQAGWPDDKPVWTGSCPCQPFSQAGKRKGFADERHLWPAFFHLIEQQRPATVFGEQVASKDGLGWLDTLQADMEGAGYACGAFDLCAAGVGSPQIRQRLCFVAERLADTHNERPQGREGVPKCTDQCTSGQDSLAERMANADSTRPFTGSKATASSRHGCPSFPNGSIKRQFDSGPVNGFWRDADWLFCRDGKWRPVKSGTSPLAASVSSRVGLLRGYGNSINIKVAKAFIESYMMVG